MIYSKKRFFQILEVCRPFKRPILILAGLELIVQVLGLCTPYFSGRIIDGFFTHKPAQTLIWFAIALLLINVIKSGVQSAVGYWHIKDIAFGVDGKVAQYTLDKVVKLSPGQVINQNSGFKREILKKGEESIKDIVEKTHQELLPTSMKLIITTVASFYLNMYFGFVVLITVIGYLVAAVWINNLTLPQIRINNRMSNELGSFYTEIIRNLRTVIIYHQGKRTKREHQIAYDAYAKQGIQTWLTYIWRIMLFREPFSVLGQFSIVLCGIHLISSDATTPGSLVIALGWSMNAFGSLNTLGGLQRALARDFVHINRYFKLLDIPPAVIESVNPIRLEKFAGRIEFRNVSFSYPEYFKDSESEVVDTEAEVPPAIHSVSFVVEPGQVCALIGHSGAGKSSIFNLLLRSYDPDKGQILIDGHDLRLLSLGDWRKSVGIVEQDPKLWDNTLAYNMTYGLNGHADKFTESDLEELAHKTRIDQFYDRLGKSRFQTLLGENGVQLSGGQRQRVAIARAIAKSPNVLLFDEATNALDPEIESEIRESINNALVGRTGLIIAHRLSTVRLADKIIVFEKGRIIGTGKHEDLMLSCPHYKQLVTREAELLSTIG